MTRTVFSVRGHVNPPSCHLCFAVFGDIKTAVVAEVAYKLMNGDREISHQILFHLDTNSAFELDVSDLKV